MEEYKILAVVKFNNSEAIVLDKKPILEYERHDELLIGMCEKGVFLNSYKYDRPSKNWKAFAGHEFDIPMIDGTVIKANGQWWDDGKKEMAEITGSEVISVTFQTKDRLEECYVFTGMSADKHEYEKLRKSYTGKVYEYYEYECEAFGRCGMWKK